MSVRRRAARHLRKAITAADRTLIFVLERRRDWTTTQGLSSFGSSVSGGEACSALAISNGR
jgi:hypothetical protein